MTQKQNLRTNMTLTEQRRVFKEYLIETFNSYPVGAEEVQFSGLLRACLNLKCM